MSFSEVCLLAKDFYDAFTIKSSMPVGTAKYPDSCTSSRKWMKRTFQSVYSITSCLHSDNVNRRNLSFQYSTKQRVAIDNVSFNVMPGQMVIVGPNGSGKSTLMKLMARLFDPTSGSILINNHPLSSFDISQLHDSMVFLSQLSQIYPVSLHENIQLGSSCNWHFKDSDIEDAARLGGSYKLIRNLPQQCDTILGPLSVLLAFFFV
jgi:ABC-type multidrug transport system fused ATPase/permease subunit